MDVKRDDPSPALETILGRLPRSAQDYLDRRRKFDREFPTMPLNVAGLAPPGKDIDRMVLDRIPEGLLPEPTKGLRGNALAEAKARNAARRGEFDRAYDAVLAYIYLRLLYDPDYEIDVATKHLRDHVPCLPGTFRTHPDPETGEPVRIECWGPRRSRVMVVGKNPGLAEIAARENFCGKGSEPLDRALRELRMESEVGHWYWTNAVKHPATTDGNPPRSHAANMLPVLQLELRLVRPDYVLCLGDDAAKAVLGPKASVSSLFGRVETIRLPLHAPGEPPAHHTARVLCCTHPAKVAYRPEAYGDLLDGLGRFRALVRGDSAGGAEEGLEHVCVYTKKALAAVVKRINDRTKGGATFAIDCEWHGRRPGDPGAYLRTIQFTDRAKTAYCVVLRSQGGRPAFDDPDAARRYLNGLFKSTPGRRVRVGGHILTADMPWLVHFGVDVRDEYAPARSPRRMRTEGGFDTHRLIHAYVESVEGGYKLESMAARFCGVPRYDVAMQRWKAEYVRQNALKAKELEGYGDAPDAILHAYALYDVDATMRLFERFNGVAGEPGLLDSDVNGRSCRRAAWLNHLPLPAILEMESAGVLIDRRRGDAVTDAFAACYDRLLAAFRGRVAWPAFNPNSHEQCKELLFGVALNSKIDKVTGDHVRLAPEGVASLGLQPIMATGKKPIPWERALEQGKAGVSMWPATGKEVLGILSHQKDKEKGRTVAMLRDLRFLSQVLKGTLRRPWVDGLRNPYFASRFGDVLPRDEDDPERIYDGGLMAYIDFDGRVRTHFGVVETGRWSSWAPNLQNISKRRDEDYMRILGVMSYDKDAGCELPKGDYVKELGGALYETSIRSIIKAREGCVLVEVDYKMAEMAIIGMLGGDAQMLEHVRRNTLKSKDPEFLDLHALTAINAFRLDTPENRATVADKAANDPKYKGLVWGATKDILAALNKKSLRVAAKNVNFGVPYGRGAEAIARQCREEGAEVSVEEAQALIDNYRATYPQVAALLDRCAARPADPGWLCGTFGRDRRFPPTDDDKIRGDQERQAQNYPIQNAVAECVNIACDRLVRFRAEHGDKVAGRDFTMCLQIHDAILFEVPYAGVSWFIDEVVPACFTDQVDIRPRDLDGKLLPDVGPFHLATDTEVERHWGEDLDAAWAESVGLPPSTPSGHEIYKPRAGSAAA